MIDTNLQKTQEKVIGIIAERLGITATTITKESFLFDDLNASKLEIADIIQTLEDEYEFKFNIEEVKSFLTVGNIIDYLVDNAE